MCVVVAADLRVRHGNNRIGHGRRIERDEAHLRGIVLVAVRAPQLIVRDENFGRDLLEQLRFGNLGAVVVLELEIQALLARRRALQEPLILLEVEPTIGLKFGRLHELRRGLELRRLHDLLICDADSTTLVFLIKQNRLDELIEHLVADLLFFIQRK